MSEPLSRSSVIEATRRLIRTEGLSAVSLRRVGSQLGVTAPALYAYVHDKEDLLRGVAEVEFQRLVDRFSTITDDDPVKRSRDYSRAYIRYAMENPELFRTMFLFPPRISGLPADGDELPAATETFTMALEATGAAIDGGWFRDDLDAVTVGITTWAATHGMATILLMGFDFDPEMVEQLTDAIIDTMYRGLAAADQE